MLPGSHTKPGAIKYDKSARAWWLRLEFAFDLVEDPPVRVLGDELLWPRLDHARLVQPERIEAERVPSLEPIALFSEGKIDAFLAGPPVLQEVRARNIGHVIVSSSC